MTERQRQEREALRKRLQERPKDEPRAEREGPTEAQRAASRRNIEKARRSRSQGQRGKSPETPQVTFWLADRVVGGNERR